MPGEERRRERRRRRRGGEGGGGRGGGGNARGDQLLRNIASSSSSSSSACRSDPELDSTWPPSGGERSAAAGRLALLSIGTKVKREGRGRGRGDSGGGGCLIFGRAGVREGTGGRRFFSNNEVKKGPLASCDDRRGGASLPPPTPSLPLSLSPIKAGLEERGLRGESDRQSPPPP